MPGILTGTIIGMAHALGETAPLLLIGMVAFIVDVPGGVTDAATVLPVQIFLWSDLPEVGFQAKTSAAIIVLLMFLLIMNGARDPAAQALRAPLVEVRRVTMNDAVDVRLRPRPPPPVDRRRRLLASADAAKVSRATSTSSTARSRR